jgi:hypothetical protein
MTRIRIVMQVQAGKQVREGRNHLGSCSDPWTKNPIFCSTVMRGLLMKIAACDY